MTSITRPGSSRARLRSAAEGAWQLVGGVSVRNKILGIVLALVIFLGLGITLQVRRTVDATLRNELQDRGASLARDLAARSVDLLLVHDLFAAHELLQDTLANNRDVRYAFLLGETGEVAAHTFTDGFPTALADANRGLTSDRYHVQRIQTPEGVIWDFAVPILEGRAGMARVGLEETTLRNTLRSITQQMGLTTLAVSLAGFLAATILTWLITRPVLDLVLATEAVGRGDLSRRARVWAKDEVGQLSSSFNVMLAELSATRSRLEHSNEQLRQRNAELERLNAVVLEKEAARGRLLEKTITAQEEERQRIARELHDDTSQMLTSLKLGLRILELPQSELDRSVQIESMRKVLDQTLESLHDLALDLRPSVLDDLGLVAALERYSKDCTRRFGLHVVMQTTGLADHRLPAATETTLYRIAQEALTNAARHAQCQRVDLLLDHHDDEVRMIIEDHGCGFDPGLARDSRRLGLYGMQERTELLGGTLRIDSSLGQGTSVVVRVPASTDRRDALRDAPVGGVDSGARASQAGTTEPTS